MSTTRRQQPCRGGQLSPAKPSTRTSTGATKRARSPEPQPETATTSHNGSKRSRPSTSQSQSTAHADDRDQKRAERETEFRVKYTKAFPSWKFYFDLDGLDPAAAPGREALETKVYMLKGQIVDFFSNEITHLITNQPFPGGDPVPGKENSHKSRSHSKQPAHLKSPIKLRARPNEDDPVVYDQLVIKAVAFGMKIWNVAKMDSVLDRCLAVPPSSSIPQPSIPRTYALAPPNPAQQRSLTRLLQSERIHGTTERDLFQKRRDHQYFARASYFVLVEDMREELATIAALEYPITKTREGAVKIEWPVLYCHPNSRGPFIPFDEKEKKRWEKSRRQDQQRDHETEARRAKAMQKEEELKRQAEAKSHAARKTGDLRRSASMHNLQQRRASHPHSVFTTNTTTPGYIDLDVDDGPESANASGFLPSGTGGYMAASGNSVGITSNAGTTSTSGNQIRGLNLNAALRGRIQQQVVTSLKATGGDRAGSGKMGPPAALPERMNLLKKSRSTNTLRLPKRKEGSKPGYCESCRTKFEDFKTHVIGRKHKKFAADESNFLQLDYVLGRARRKTKFEVAEEARQRKEMLTVVDIEDENENDEHDTWEADAYDIVVSDV